MYIHETVAVGRTEDGVGTEVVNGCECRLTGPDPKHNKREILKGEVTKMKCEDKKTKGSGVML